MRIWYKLSIPITLALVLYVSRVSYLGFVWYDKFLHLAVGMFFTLVYREVNTDDNPFIDLHKHKGEEQSAHSTIDLAWRIGDNIKWINLYETDEDLLDWVEVIVERNNLDEWSMWVNGTLAFDKSVYVNFKKSEYFQLNGDKGFEFDELSYSPDYVSKVEPASGDTTTEDAFFPSVYRFMFVLFLVVRYYRKKNILR